MNEPVPSLSEQTKMPRDDGRVMAAASGPAAIDRLSRPRDRSHPQRLRCFRAPSRAADFWMGKFEEEHHGRG